MKIAGRGFTVAEGLKFNTGFFLLLEACWRLKVMRLEVGKWLFEVYRFLFCEFVMGTTETE